MKFLAMLVVLMSSLHAFSDEAPNPQRFNQNPNTAFLTVCARGGSNTLVRENLLTNLNTHSIFCKAEFGLHSHYTTCIGQPFDVIGGIDVTSAGAASAIMTFGTSIGDKDGCAVIRGPIVPTPDFGSTIGGSQVGISAD